VEESGGTVFGLGGVRIANQWFKHEKSDQPQTYKSKGDSISAFGLAFISTTTFEHPALKVGVLLAVAIWSFCRFYYFAFYVIQYYVDPSYQFSGLISLVRYLIHQRK